jgi:hypothetical protein
MISEIETYLQSSQDFETGVALYLKFSESKPLKSLFESGNSSYSHSKLLHSLKEISESTIPKQLPESKASPLDAYKTKHESNVVQIRYSELPPALKERHRHKAALYKQAKDYHSALYDANNKQTRFEFAKQILTNFHEIDDIWKELEDYQEKGILRVPAKADSELDTLTALELANLRDNYKKNLYKVKGAPGKESRYQELYDLIKEVENALQIR